MRFLFSALYWNPSRDAFTIPIIDRPITWYGLLFATGLALCYLMLIAIFKVQIAREEGKPSDDRALFLVDRLLWYAVIGTLVGARLGHVFFYQPFYFFSHPLDIVKVWQGGLASHGAAIGIFIAIYLYYIRYRDKLPGRSFWGFLDLFTIPIPIAGACIRVGNFINQEILGTASSLPWAITFGHPVDGLAIIPRHPVMLYEALCYLIIFAVTFTIWKKGWNQNRTGLLSGLFFFLVFTARFIMEFFKVAQTDIVLIPGLRMGQILSLPFILLGVFLIMKSAYSNVGSKSPLK